MRRAPEWEVERWLNAAEPPSVASWRGRIVVAYAFQTGCPGCVDHALPQLVEIREAYSPEEVVVAALHTSVEPPPPGALEEFLLRRDIRFPVAVDRPTVRALPRTAELYGLAGTPALLLIDREGSLRRLSYGTPARPELETWLETLRTGAGGSAEVTPPR